MYSDLWIEERYQDLFGLRIKVEEVLFSGKSEFQTVDVVRTRGYGNMLLNDGLIMVTEKDEFAYHDMICHVPMFVHPKPKKVLVIGGGDGGTAREVLRHPSVEQCTMVEIDGMVVDACRQHIPKTAKDLDHPKMKLIIGDGVKFVKETDEKFDVIMVDSTDPIGPAQPLFGVEFYNDVFNCLTDDGIVVAQGQSAWWENDIQQSLLGVLKQVFPSNFLYTFSNLTYPGGLWSFTFSSKKYHPLKDFNPERVKASGLSFDYYNAGVHQGAFSLPSFVAKALDGFVDNE